jgi:hypothetical protein
LVSPGWGACPTEKKDFEIEMSQYCIDEVQYNLLGLASSLVGAPILFRKFNPHQEKILTIKLIAEGPWY